MELESTELKMTPFSGMGQWRNGEILLLLASHFKEKRGVYYSLGHKDATHLKAPRLVHADL